MGMLMPYPKAMKAKVWTGCWTGNSSLLHLVVEHVFITRRSPTLWQWNTQLYQPQAQKILTTLQRSKPKESNGRGESLNLLQTDVFLQNYYKELRVNLSIRLQYRESYFAQIHPCLKVKCLCLAATRSLSTEIGWQQDKKMKLFLDQKHFCSSVDQMDLALQRKKKIWADVEEIIFQAWSLQGFPKSKSFLAWSVLTITWVHRHRQWCRSPHLPFRLDNNDWVSLSLSVEGVLT